MALNLISSYESDDEGSGSDNDGSYASPSNGSSHISDVNCSKSLEKEVMKKTSYIFGVDDGSSSDEEQIEQSKSVLTVPTKPMQGTSRRLPSAGSILTGTHLGSSVFSSEREREDHAQALTLSQHVPLTERVETKKKPICRAFTRGKCRRGDRCRFAHPVASIVSKDSATIASAPRMYNADDVFAKKPKIL